MPIIIDTRNKVLSALYMDDYLSLGKIFADIFKFLHETYFPHVIFSQVYSIGKNLFAFDDKFDILGF